MKLRFLNLSQAVFIVVVLLGCVNDGTKVTKSSSPALAGQPDAKNAAAHGNRGIDLFERNEFNKAIREFDESIRLNPSDPLAYYYRGVSFVLIGQNNKALADLDQAIKLNPKYSEAYQYRGIAHGRSKQFQDSVSDFKQAIEINPKDAYSYSCLAALRATCYVDDIRNPAEAVQAATKACDLTDWKVAQHIDRLAAAWAENGDWEKAIKYQNDAIRAGAATQEDRNRMNIRLTLYMSHLKFRDPTIFE